MPTLRCILALAAHNNWIVSQLDINNAFLHGDLIEEVYMHMPKGIANTDNKVCRLKKSIYGLKQASRQWYAKLVTALQSQSFTHSKSDYSLFIKKSNGQITIAAVYVDDIVLTGTDSNTITALKTHLHSLFSIKDLGPINYFLGMKVTKTNQGFILSQAKFAQDLIKCSGFEIQKTSPTPLPINLKLHTDKGHIIPNPSHYRSIIGKLNFLTNTRPDLSYAVQTLSQFMHTPREPHLAALRHVLKYVSGTLTQGILLNGAPKLVLQAFADADWAACPTTRRSITGYLVLLGQSPISWKSKKQSVVSRSSCESEYRAMASAASELTWLVRLLEELDCQESCLP